MDDTEALAYKIFTRVNRQKYEQLQNWAEGSRQDMSGLLRDIIYNRPIRIITHDNTFNDTMQELVKIRTELKSIGININQITRLFNTYPEKTRKEFYAKTAFHQYTAIHNQVNRLYVLTEKLTLKWLSK
ncbi:hypothetical protein FLA_0452 [Filimonas lacunae]|nr:hypothetical protein FLA_0452 [Filimonas lacunae]